MWKEGLAVVGACTCLPLLLMAVLCFYPYLLPLLLSILEESLKCWSLSVGSLLSLRVSSVGKGENLPIFQAHWEHVRCDDSETRAECGGDIEGCQRHS